MLLSLFALVLAAQETPPPAPVEGLHAFRPEWASEPTVADLIEAYPVSAFGTGKGGTVTMICRATVLGGLERCDVVSDTSRADGFSEASLKLVSRFRLKAFSQDGAVIGQLVRVPIDWSLPEQFAVDGLPYDVVPRDRLTWTSRVRPTKVIADAPTVRLVCRINAAGKLTPCARPGEGRVYDGPAKWTTRKLTVAPLDRDGAPVKGRLVILDFPDVKSKLP